MSTSDWWPRSSATRSCDTDVLLSARACWEVSIASSEGREGKGETGKGRRGEEGKMKRGEEGKGEERGRGENEERGRGERGGEGKRGK